VKRLPVAAFAALAIATAAAFFFIQHLKVSTPLIAGAPSPHPATINPISGGICPYPGPHGKPIPTSFREMKISFYLLNRNDHVDVFIIKPDGVLVDTIATDVPMVAKPHPKRHQFIWNGRLTDGQVAPDGNYEVKVTLLQQGRSYVIADASTGAELPVTVQTTPPSIRVTSVRGPGGELPAVIPTAGGTAATIHYTGTGKLRPQIQIYRSTASGRLHLVKTYSATTSSGTSVWNGTLRHQQPAPRGTYVIGLKLTDATCNQIRWPATLHPAPGSVANASVTIR
jgi:hypothetical protein